MEGGKSEYTSWCTFWFSKHLIEGVNLSILLGVLSCLANILLKEYNLVYFLVYFLVKQTSYWGSKT